MEKTNYKNSLFLEFLNRRIKDREVSRKKVSEALGINQKTVSNWFLGKNAPSAYNYIKLCQILDIDPRSILF